MKFSTASGACGVLRTEFTIAFKELIHFGGARRLTLICLETVWWRCQLPIITDYLLQSGHAIDHLIGLGHTEHAKHSRHYPLPPPAGKCPQEHGLRPSETERR